MELIEKHVSFGGWQNVYRHYSQSLKCEMNVGVYLPPKAENENYQIGASYFLKLKNIDFDQLWSDYLHPLLQEYINGMYDEEGIMERFKKAYNQGKSYGADVDESN